MKTALILLNYNDSEAVKKALERVQGFSSIDRVIIVDNASEESSRKELERVSGTVIWNDKNGGYGYGNNRGVQAAAEAGCELSLIANPDAVFTEETVEHLVSAFADTEVAAAGALMEGKPARDCAFPLLGFKDELLFSGPVLKRIFRRRVQYPASFFRALPKEVGAVHGSLLMVRNRDFLSVGGFDERFFLFCEEKVLGKKFRDAGKRTVLTKAVYSHAGSETMKKNGFRMVDRQRIRQDSEILYYKEYLHASKSGILAAKMLQAVVMLETRIISGK